jgi:hypothetical protein
MKTIAMVFLSLFLAKNCKEKQQVIEQQTATQNVATNQTTLVKDNPKQQATTLEYEALSRGYFCKIIFANNKLTVYKDRDNLEKGEAKELSKADQSEINAFINSYKPENLKTLKGVNESRMYDGAAHANFSLIQNGETYQTEGFDAGDPPKPIEKVVQIMVSYSQEKE